MPAGCAPIELYEMVSAELPLYVEPDAAPDPELLKVTLFKFDPKATPEMVEFCRALFGMFETESVGVKVKVPPELVMVVPTVIPLAVAAEEVAKVIAPVCVAPYVCLSEVTAPAEVR